jgi:anti-sigma factor RsiW
VPWNAAPVTCPVPEEQAYELLDDELAPAAAAAVRAHLARCSACRARVARLARFLAVLRRQRLHPTPAPEALRRRARRLGGDAGPHGRP